MICVAHDCERPDVTTEFAVPPVEPAAEILCLNHFRALVEHRANVAIALAHQEAMAALPKMTCYGDGGRCPHQGTLFPSGLWCDEHTPNPFDSRGMNPDVLRRAVGASPAVNPFADDEPPTVNTHADEADDAGPEYDSEPVQPASDCPEDKLPGSVKSAVRHALANSWDHRATYAVGPEPDAVHSVAFTAFKDGVCLSSRHEGQDPEHLGFKIAWFQREAKLPLRLGWRELIAALQGQSPTDTDRQQMKDAVLTAMDAGGELVEINTTG